MFYQKLFGWIRSRLRDKQSAKVILILTGVLALDGADKGAVGSMSRKLELAFDIGPTELGLLLTVSLLVGAAATMPFGHYVDRVNRVRLLWIVVGGWAVMMGVMAIATSYTFLLAARAGLGAVTAAAAPSVASLTGDYFATEERGKIYGYILTGELIGTGIGFTIAGELATISWRVGFLGLVPPAILLAWLASRLPEPRRGGQARLSLDGQGERSTSGSETNPETEEIREEVREEHFPPRKELIPEGDPQQKSLRWAFWYVLSIRTNLLLIIASALSYYFFAGVRTFGIQWLESHFHLTQSAAIPFLLVLGVGSIIGVVIGGRIGDWLIQRGHVRGRVTTAAVAAMISAVVFAPGLIATNLYGSAVAVAFGGFALGAMSPPLDAARLDIMHHLLWGRAEAVRMVVRRAGEAASPVVFGLVAAQGFGGGPQSMRNTFLIMLIPLFASGIIIYRARKTYPRDVATAGAWAEQTRKEQ